MISTPLRPLLAPWYRLVPDGDRLLLEHARTVVVLEGAAVRSFVPALLALLDGSRTVDELAAALGESTRPALEETLARLSAQGLLFEGPSPTGVPATVPALAAAYGLAPAVVADRLAALRIGVVGGSSLGSRAVRALEAAGVRSAVARIAPQAAPSVEFALVTPAAGEVSLLPEWNRAALESGTCWIGLRPFDGLALTIGPLVVPGESCCYECLRLRLASHLEYGGELALIEGRPAATACSPALELVAVGILAQLALDWVIGHDPALPGTMHLLEARPTIGLSRHAVLRVPRCSACSSVERVASRLPWHAAEADRGVAA